MRRRSFVVTNSGLPMAAGYVYGDRQIQSWNSGSGLSCQLPTTSPASDPRRGDHRCAPTHWRLQRRTTRAIGATQIFNDFSRMCPKSAGFSS